MRRSDGDLARFLYALVLGSIKVLHYEIWDMNKWINNECHVMLCSCM